ncbi:acetyl-CoA carboxylase, carboxyltransferase subunit beta [Saccharopolyspora indica]|uniref:acetyl-CoA carboxylase, carboxyltransferase subunit beta n=1 Tax=Saccharopolyspora indica TaxID=1229659 RepID=UPI0022EB7C1E|nr:acetyl-CoA carboxylase, carboxyltransferase subunit beta [Saccharopolyspora indica]MDA3648379.1 acetyl-CoA carboxylase, carboxyltransferase subunit beta [Saccharopolyspora indica]
MGDAVAVESEVDTSWLVCPGCSAMVYGKRFARAHQVCPECGRHAPLTARQRIDLLLDADSVELLDFSPADTDPLDFTDTKPYAERLREARARTGLDEAILCARGRVDGNPLITAVMDFRFMGGSLGSAVGEAVTRACETALRERTPLLLVTASGGARMQEGVLSLMQMAKTSAALGQLDEAGILTVSLITDPTFGGVAASFATLPDVIIAEPGSRLGFAGRRVIEQTLRQQLPADFQTAEFLSQHGVIDMIRPRDELRPALAKLLSVASRRADGTGRPRRAPATTLVRDPGRLPENDAWDSVRAARRLGRPTTADYVAGLVEDFSELRGDRMSSDCPAMLAGIGRLEGTPVAVIGTQKGHTAEELAASNYGMPSPAGYRKAARVMRLAGKLGLPVITLVDTAGAFPGVEAEENAQASAIAENLRLMASLPVPVISVITGEGGSGGALALAVADRVLMCANAVYSVISAEGCAAILWKDPAAAPEAANALRVTARELLRLGVIDGVVPEPAGGADTDHLATTEALRDALVANLAELAPLDQMNLVTQRHARFRQFGADEPMPFAPGEAGAPTDDEKESAS